MTRSGRHFTDESKYEAVRLAEQSDSNVSRMAQDSGPDPSVLRRWIGQMRDGTWEPATGKPLSPMQFEAAAC
ncbi:MAG: transposase [Xanthomonadaceae bacterium]|jgi:transposase-like protein|nr:transposase [Xanthomonadaceae bacterium]